MPFKVLDQVNGLPSPTSRPNRRRALTQIIDMQERAFEIASDPNVKETVRCFAMRSFCSLQEERRKLSMQPLPKPVDVTPKAKRSRAKDASFEEPAGPVPVPEVSQTVSQPDKPKP